MDLLGTALVDPLLVVGGRSLSTMASAVLVLEATTTCEELERRFAAAPDVLAALCPGDAGALGLLTRAAFEATLSGRYGFGRSLHHRRRVHQLADWSPLVLDGDTVVEKAASALLSRPDDLRHQPVVTVSCEGLGVVSAAAVFEGLAGAYATRALHDGLTGLANRALFVQRLAAACAAAARNEAQRVAVAFVDLDRFKAVNDALGHTCGDELLRTVASRLRASLRPGDVVARLGGDEFAVLTVLDGAAADDEALAAVLGRRLCSALRRPVPLCGASVVSRASVGIAVSAPGAAHGETLLREADLAMYRAKGAGGDQWVLVPAVGHALHSRPLMSVDDTLPRALQAGEFRVHYQPIVDARTGRTASTEALVRWQHPERGLLPPGHFLPAAEENGAIVALGGWVLLESCRQLAAWDADPSVVAPVFMNVNVSVRQLLSGELEDQVTTALAASGVEPWRLRLELSEEATLAELQSVSHVLLDVRHLGVHLTLDDVGAGSSSLRHLTELPVDGIKIDRSFIAAMLDEPRELAIVRALVDLGTSLDLRVTAEGVETAEQQALLVSLGCGYLQGYHLGRPVPAEQVVLDRPATLLR